MDSSNHDVIKVHELPFRPLISEKDILKRVHELGSELRERLREKKPVYMVMLRGAFIFAADLIRAISVSGEVCFVRTSSYHGTKTEGKVRLHIAPEREIVKGRDIILIEDIVDSGYTMQAFMQVLEKMDAASITLVTLLHKPEAMQVDVKVDMAGFVIPPKFVVGYGLDYDGHGRHLPTIYELVEEF